MKQFCLSCFATMFIFVLGVGTLGLWLRATWQRNMVGEACPSNLKQIALGMFMYAEDYDGKLPSAIFHDKTVGWANGLQPYMRSYEIFQCPIETNHRQKTPHPNQPRFTDYWMNSNLSGMDSNHVKRPEQLIMLGDGDGGSPASTASYAINRLPAAWLQLPNSPATRHWGGANYAFADGHVKWLHPNEVSQLPYSEKHPFFTFANK